MDNTTKSLNNLFYFLYISMPPKKSKKTAATQVKTSSVTDTKILVALVSLAVAGGLAFAALPAKKLTPSQPVSGIEECNPTLLEYSKVCKNNGFQEIVFQCSGQKKPQIVTAGGLKLKACPSEKQWINFVKDSCASSCKPKNKQEAPKEESENLGCVDSDGGIVYEISGEINGNADRCLDGFILEEKYCKDEQHGGGPDIIRHRCEFGCENGFCLTSDTVLQEEIEENNSELCVDSDGGREFQTPGSVSWSRDGQNYSLVDRCNPNDPSGNGLEEAICDGPNGPDRIRENCQYGCVDGACAIPLTSCRPNLPLEPGKTYVLENDVSNNRFGSYCFAISDDSTIDCQGHTIYGEGRTGILSGFRRNINIKNCNIDGFDVGVQLQTFRGSIQNVSVTNSRDIGFHLTGNYDEFLFENNEACGSVNFDAVFTSNFNQYQGSNNVLGNVQHEEGFNWPREGVNFTSCDL